MTWKGGLGFALTLQSPSFALTQCLLKAQTVIVVTKEFRRVLLVQKMELHNGIAPFDNGWLPVQSSGCLRLPFFCLLLCQNIVMYGIPATNCLKLVLL